MAFRIGESLPWHGSYVDLDPDTKDRFGLQAARITHQNRPLAKKASLNYPSKARLFV